MGRLRPSQQNNFSGGRVAQEKHSVEDGRGLVKRFLGTRDEVCFRELYAAHTPGMFLLALRMLGGAQADAEDSVQEAWVRAIRALETFRWDSSLRTWLCGITINCCREILRGHKPRAEPVSAEELPAIARPESALSLEALVQALPDGYRQVLVLHDVEGYTHDEIAALLGIEPGTSKSQLSRARATLRKWLGPREIPAGDDDE